ncbi:MAG: hypothetical protein UEP29_14795 [Phocaeicola massiliensis]|nr:hypothetical protein [Phocaeicola massiliensis]
MNKFTYLLLFLFCMMGVMNAQELEISGFTKAAENRTLPAELTTGYYLIKEVNLNASGKPGGYLKSASEAANAVITPQGKNTAYDGSNALELWYVEMGQDNQTFTISTANKKAAWQAPYQGQKNLVVYANKANLTKTTESVTLGNKTAKAADGSCIIQNDKKTACVHYSSNALGSWTDANPASVMMFEFYKVEEADLIKAVKVTYTYQLEGTSTTIVKEVAQAVGSNYNAPVLDFITFTQPVGTVTGGENVTVNCTENLPFEKTTDLKNPKWFAIDMHSNQNRYMCHYEADNQNISVAVPGDLVSISKDDAYFWCLTGNVFDGFQIYNKKAGTNKSLNTTTDKPQITEGEKHTIWHIVKPQSSISNAACFKADNTQFLNHQGDNTLGYWSDADEGSSCRFFKPAAIAMEQAELYANMPENAIGAYTGVEQLDPAITEAEKDLFNFGNANKLVDAIKALKPNGVTLKAGKYYRLQNKYYQSRYANADMTGKENMQKAISSVVLFEATETENQYHLKMQGQGLGHVTKSNQIRLTTDKNNMGSFQVIDKGNALYALKDVTSTEKNFCYIHDASSQSHNLVGWGESADASQWYIVEATDVEVTLNTADNASYATVYLPFAVSSVQGATAYIGQKQGESTLRATAIEAGIPANTGVILKGAANEGKAVLTLGTATSNAEGNALTGTLVEKDYTNELVFGKSAEGAVGFYSMAAGKKIGANKAYLEAATTTTQAMKLVFDGDVTGIENVMGEAADANAPIYDLTGRRVMKAVKGGLYIQNGKKFIAQ